MEQDFYRKAEEIISRDARYKLDAYEFVMQSLWFTQKRLKRNGHITGKELLEGIREFGLAQYGPMTKTVFAHWGVEKTEDFGNIVFSMVEKGMMSKTEKDTREDFRDVYDFNAALDIFNAGE